jgi:MFS family permease
LVSEFNLTSGELGLLGGGYFLGFASVQIPLGYLLDSKGPRKIVSYFLSLSIIGLILFSLAQNLTMLLISRILIGVGVGACLMGPLTAYRIWFQDETQQRANSWMLMVGAIGMLSSSLPVQFFLPIIGWRAIFLSLALLTLACIILIVIFIPKWHSKSVDDKQLAESKLRYSLDKPFISKFSAYGFFYLWRFVCNPNTMGLDPWMIRVSGYTPQESANGTFFDLFCYACFIFVLGLFRSKIFKKYK